ncbi:mRNA-decapping enzyme subunit 2 [Cryptococcus neoformans c45]|nr:mRNA-decapping enzyme subunit 2 [Cryptococcus neoformans var. grubii c45]
MSLPVHPHLHSGYYSPSSSSSPLESNSFPVVGPDPDDTTTGDDEDNMFRDMSFDEILEDLNARFLINLPKEEMNLLRVYWQAEQAHWFYEDYLRPLNPSLPSLSQRQFTRLIIESSPLYSRLVSGSTVDYESVWDEYKSYKRMVPCCGGILLNKEGDKVLLVRGWKSNAGWSFPRGKINLAESEEACAVREVEEETGFDLTGMVKPDDKIKTHINAQEVTMFIVPGIDEATEFETQTRHEIGAIEWVPLQDLPTWSANKRGPRKTGKAKRFYNVTPFVNPLKSWMKEHGMNPYPKARQSKPTSKDPSVFHRDIQPFRFDSFTGSPSNSPVPQAPSPSHLPSRGSSALDQLFTKFIHKQEEEIMAPSRAGALGSDNNAGLERLFNGLNVLQEEEDALRLRQRQQAEEEMTKKEDDALARLLGGVGGATPQQEAHQPQLQPQPQGKTLKQTNLLAMLNQKPSEAPPAAKTQSSTQTQTQVQLHHDRLLSVISPQAPPSSLRTNVAALSGTGDAVGTRASDAGAASTTSQPGTGSANRLESKSGEIERQARARALLDMTIAGIGSSSATETRSAPTTAATMVKARIDGEQGKQLVSHPLGPMQTQSTILPQSLPPNPPRHPYAPYPSQSSYPSHLPRLSHPAPPAHPAHTVPLSLPPHPGHEHANMNMNMNTDTIQARPPTVVPPPLSMPMPMPMNQSYRPAAHAPHPHLTSPQNMQGMYIGPGAPHGQSLVQVPGQGQGYYQPFPGGSPPHTQIGSQPISVSMPGPGPGPGSGPGPGVGSGPRVGAGSGIGYYNSPPVSQGQGMFPRQVNGNANGQQQQQQNQHPLPMPPIHNQGLPPQLGQMGQYNHVGQAGQNGKNDQNGQRTLPTKASFGGVQAQGQAAANVYHPIPRPPVGAAELLAMLNGDRQSK